MKLAKAINSTTYFNANLPNANLYIMQQVSKKMPSPMIILLAITQNFLFAIKMSYTLPFFLKIQRYY